MYIFPHLLTHSSTGGRLGYVHTSASVSDAAMNTGVHAPFGVSVWVFFRYILMVGLQGHIEKPVCFMMAILTAMRVF